MIRVHSTKASINGYDWLALGRATIASISCFGPISMLKVSGSTPISGRTRRAG
jgi:hypothetical protein